MINAYAHVFGYLGYQIHSRKFFQALNRKHPVCLTPLQENILRVGVEPDIHDMVARQKNISLNDPAIILAYGNEFHKGRGSCTIGYTVFEYTKLPHDWLNLMHQIDTVWTTSSWGKDVLVRNGIPPERIGIVPEGVDPFMYRPREREEKHGAFRFLSVGKWEKRKGQAELLRAWAEVFRGVKDVELVVSWHNPFLTDFSVENEIRKLNLGTMPPITLVGNIPHEQAMAELYASADAFVLPTRGEGWGLTIMEAMASGLPVITTRYSAITDYAHDDIAYLIDVERMVPVHDEPFFPVPGEQGEWAEIDYEQLKELLWHVYTHRDEARCTGLKASKEVLNKWTWDHAAEKALALLHDKLRFSEDERGGRVCRQTV